MKRFTGLTRIIVCANGHTIGWAFTMKEAMQIGEEYRYECATQEDDPWDPEIAYEYEQIESDFI